MVVAGLCLAASLQLRAEPSLPWTPSPAARHALALLVDDAGLDLTLSHWPLPASAVQRALDALPAQLSMALEAARSQVAHELGRHRSGVVSATLRGRDAALVGFGDIPVPGPSLAMRSPAAAADGVVARFGARVQARGEVPGTDRLRLEESAFVTEAFGFALQAFAHRQWWGPGWQSSLLLGHNTSALGGIGLQRATAARSETPWLAWLGPWNYEAFLAVTDDAVGNSDPYLFGQRLTFRPLSNLEFGLTHIAQWGGRGRPRSLRDLLRGLVGMGLNGHTPEEQASDPANAMAGYDLRWRCPTGVRCAVYAQLIGEDQAGGLPSRLLGLYGVEAWSADGRDRYLAEYAETGCNTPIGRSPAPGLRLPQPRLPPGLYRCRPLARRRRRTRLPPAHPGLARHLARCFDALSHRQGRRPHRQLRRDRRQGDLGPHARLLGAARVSMGTGRLDARVRLAADRGGGWATHRGADRVDLAGRVGGRRRRRSCQSIAALGASRFVLAKA